MRASCLVWLLVLARASASVFQLADMVAATTEQEWSKYANYGCYCGAGNSGTNVTTDCSDGCCEVHDNGYSELSDSHCNPYWTVYKFALHPLACLDTMGSCARRLCEQDRTLSLCLSRWKNSYSGLNVDVRYTFCRREGSLFNKTVCREDSVWSEPATAELILTSSQPATSLSPRATPGLSQQPTAVDQSSTRAEQVTSFQAPPTFTQSPPTTGLLQVSYVQGDTLLELEHGSRQSSPAVKDYGQPTACMAMLGLCRVFSLAEVLLWITMVTILFVIGALLCFCTGVFMGRRKQDPCVASSTCSCCCVSRIFRYHKLSSGNDLPDTLSEL